MARFDTLSIASFRRFHRCLPTVFKESGIEISQLEAKAFQTTGEWRLRQRIQLGIKFECVVVVLPQERSDSSGSRGELIWSREGRLSRSDGL